MVWAIVWAKMMNILKNSSLRIRLIVILSVSAVLIWCISTTVAWWQVRKEVNEVFDAQQILFAKRLASSDLQTLLVDKHSDYLNYKKKRPHFKKKVDFDDDALAFAIFTPNGEILLSDGKNGDNFIFNPKVGFSHATIRGDDDHWRIFWLPIREGRLMIAVGQEMDYRDDLVYGMVFGQMWIWFASLPFLLGIIIWIISKEVKILRLVSEDVSRRTPDDNSKLSTENLPREILPLVNSLNMFFDRTSSQLLRERRFTSDAAHELRSPLTALRVQTEVAQMVGDEPRLRQQALQNLTQGIDRATQLVEQLLTLSRLDNLQELEHLEEIHWDKLLPSLIGELYFHAQKRQIELQFDLVSLPSIKQGQPLLASLMVRNLIDNAIRYCAEKSLIQVKLYSDRLVVEDNGGGVNEDDLPKLGERFFRPAGQNEKGSGLGLSIVQRIAQLHHYQVKMENIIHENKQKGLKVTILLSPSIV